VALRVRPLRAGRAAGTSCGVTAADLSLARRPRCGDLPPRDSAAGGT